MKVLFVHQNFPGQFRHLAPALAAQGHEVVAMTMQPGGDETWAGVRLLRYRPARGSTPGIHPWAVDFETKAIRAEAAFRAALELRAQGFVPDVVVAHPGWGESLFLCDVWPSARLGIYCEFFYRAEGADVGFDPEFASSDPGEVCRLHLKNVNNVLHMARAQGGIAPTHWQRSTFPTPFRDRITVVHDGIDTEALQPAPDIQLTLGGTLRLSRQDEIITFVNRNLEPYRGYHVFIRALPELLRRRPKARVLLVGGDDVSYGAQPPAGRTWKDIFLEEVRGTIDPARVHFLGNIPYASFVALLQLSTVHVYWTYPFVLSWSLLEAMSIGCAIVASRTQPLTEAIVDGRTGRLVDFFDGRALVETVCELLEQPDERARLGAAARRHAQQEYDLQAVCLPRQVAWVHALAGAGSAS